MHLPKASLIPDIVQLIFLAKLLFKKKTLLLQSRFYPNLSLYGLNAVSTLAKFAE